MWEYFKLKIRFITNKTIFSMSSLIIFAKVCFSRSLSIHHIYVSKYTGRTSPLFPVPRLRSDVARLFPGSDHLCRFREHSWAGAVFLAGQALCLPLSPPLLPQGFNWTLFIQSVLSSVKIKMLQGEEVVVYGTPYLQNLEDIIDLYSAR